MTTIVRPEEWTSSATDALEIVMADADGATAAEFKPELTYQIFGRAETVYGYKDLRLKLRFGGPELLPLLETTYADKLEDESALAELVQSGWEDAEGSDGSDGEGEAADTGSDEPDPDRRLRQFLPAETCADEATWRGRLRPAAEFAPPGQRRASYERAGATYEIWKAAVTDAGAAELLRRMQILVLLFIEGGSYIDLTDDRWLLYTVYERAASGPRLVGFATVYSYWWFKSSELHDAAEVAAAADFFALAHRKRISQFLILPPYHRQGHGAALYNALMDEYLADAQVREVTVEDPSQSFDDLRDRCDLLRLARRGVWADAGFGPAPVARAWLERTQEAEKMATRQFVRCVEMAQLSRLDKTDREAYRQYRLQVKRRLFHHNYDSLATASDVERIAALDSGYQAVEADYHRLVDGLDLAGAAAAAGVAEAKGKARAADEAAPAAKRPRV
ncbi:acyl-CoA N-acyltransferase [Dipodascopsis tothii]|uniref:acyl-CoA N-acyltransferase n=1 Tax=Dipodascopsis tothii TaxID=44089 RepID=UPI0034CF673C